MKDIVRGEHIPYLLHMSWTTNKKNKLVFLQQMGLWYTKHECESGGGVEVAKGVSKGQLEASCCSADPIIKCNYSDKPSVEQCKDSSAPTIDKDAKHFW